MSKKTVQISAANFYLVNPENVTLTPLRKANKRGLSSAGWNRGYQAVKHNRSKSLAQGNLKNFIRGLAGLYILNLYHRDNFYDLKEDESATNFDSSLGSAIFSVSIHTGKKGVSIADGYQKNANFDQCIYLVEPTAETYLVAQDALKLINEKAHDITVEKLSAEVRTLLITDPTQIESSLAKTAVQLKKDNLHQVIKESGHLLKTAFVGIRYKAVLNKQQY